jgi:hypothetical protein
MAIWDISFASMARSSTVFGGRRDRKPFTNLKLPRQEKFLYTRDTLHMWEWDIRVLDIEDGVEEDRLPR